MLPLTTITTIIFNNSTELIPSTILRCHIKTDAVRRKPPKQKGEKMTFAEKIFAELDDEIANDDADLASGSTKCVCVGDEVCCVLFESIAASGTRSGEIYIYIYIYIYLDFTGLFDLCLDRSNWEFGEKNINYLVIFQLSKGIVVLIALSVSICRNVSVYSMHLNICNAILFLYI
jgi:hypothetical protein